jgi:hypothetical protein
MIRTSIDGKRHANHGPVSRFKPSFSTELAGCGQRGISFPGFVFGAGFTDLVMRAVVVPPDAWNDWLAATAAREVELLVDMPCAEFVAAPSISETTLPHQASLI